MQLNNNMSDKWSPSVTFVVEIEKHLRIESEKKKRELASLNSSLEILSLSITGGIFGHFTGRVHGLG